MSLEDLRARLEERIRARAGVPASLQSQVYKQTRCPHSHIHVPDPLMDLPSLEDVKRFLKLDKTDELPYIKDKFDCDNYSGVLRGKALLYAQSKGENWAFAECESNKYGGHRFNLVAVKPNATVYFIEPQDDSFFTQPGRFKFIVF
jgi:hypothetical protein